jgi:hypothetical protein
LKNNLFKNGGDQKAGKSREISRNTEEWIGTARGWSMVIVKEIDEIRPMGRLRKQSKDRAKSSKIEQDRRGDREDREMSRKMDEWIAECQSR